MLIDLRIKYSTIQNDLFEVLSSLGIFLGRYSEPKQLILALQKKKKKKRLHNHIKSVFCQYS